MTNPSRTLRTAPLLLLAPFGLLFLGRADTRRQAPDRVTRITLDAQSWIRVDARANTHTPSTQDEPSVSVAADGSSSVVWQSRRQQEGTYGVYERSFAASGECIGEERAINLWTRTDQTEPAVALGGGIRWAAWESRGQDGDGSGVFLRRLDRNTETRISRSPSGDQTGVTLAAGPRGGVAAAWLDAGAGTIRARVRLFARDGTPRTEELDLGEASAVSVASNRHGILAVWTHPARGLLARRIDWRGTARARSVRVDDGGGEAIEPALAAGREGFAVVWMALADDARTYAVRLRQLDRDGVPAAASRVVSTHGAWNSGGCVACLANGRTAVAWNAEDLRSDASRVLLRLVAADGTLGSSYEIGHGRLRVADGRTGIAAGRDGRLAVAWSGDAGFGDSAAVQLTMLVPDRGAGLATVARAKKPLRRPPPQDGVLALGGFATGELDVTFTSEALAEPHDPPFEGEPDEGLESWGKGGSIQQAGGDYGFPGFGTGFVKLTPPDPHLAVGPNHVVSIVNSGIAIWKKDGTRTFLQSIYRTNNFWWSVGGTGFIFDPEVHWDPHAKRFVAMACERAGSLSFFDIAISDDQDPNGIWHKYRVDVTPTAGSSIDSPNLGIDDKAFYLTADMYGSRRQYAIYIMEKKPLLDGKTPGIAKALSMAPFSGGIPVMWGTGPAMYIIHHGTSTSVQLSAIRNPLTTPSIVSTTLTVPFYSSPARLTQKGTTGTISTFNQRFWSCMWRNGSLWACHHQGSPVKSRWYEIKTNNWPTSGAPTLVQSGDVQVGPGKHATFNSITADESGNALMTFASSSPTDYISIARCWRAATDPKGTMRPPVIIRSNTSPYLSGRWGDYSGSAADPADPNTIWYTHELAPTSSWTTWIGRKKTAILGTDVATLSAATGGSVNFFLDNPGQKNKPYLILGTMSGTSPGFRLGGLQVPINIDAFTTFVLGLSTSQAFQGFFGVLDQNGNACAKMTLPPVPGVRGTMHFSFVQDLVNWVHASPAASVSFVP